MFFGFGIFFIDMFGKVGFIFFLICIFLLVILLDVWVFFLLKLKIGIMGFSDGFVFKYWNVVFDVCFFWVVELKFFFRIVFGGRIVMLV